MDFGFLIDKEQFQFCDCEIKPLSDIDDTLREFYDAAQVYNGWILPELEPKQQGFPENNDFRINSVMVAPIFYELKPTHSIILKSEDPAKAKFLILAYGFLQGLYLCPYKNLYIKRVPYQRGKLTDFTPLGRDYIIGMNAFAKYYDESDDHKRKLLFSILHWFLIGQCYEYEWDRLIAQYFVLDAIYQLSGLGKIAHAEKPERLANYYGIDVPDWAVTHMIMRNNRKKTTCTLAEIRNELFHEAKYAGEPIGYNYPNEHFDPGFRRFNLQSIISIVGLKTHVLRLSVTLERDSWKFE